MESAPPTYTPAQQDVLSQLGMPRSERPVFEDNLKIELKAELEAQLGSLAEVIPDGERLWVNKRALSQVTKCEASYLADLESPFAWNIHTARGTLVHKAIELSVYWSHTPTARGVVDEVLARHLNSSDDLSLWIQSLSEADMADLRSVICAHVTTFLECWPPLKREWRPTLESKSTVEIAQGKVILSGKVDIAVGQADGNIANKVIVDFKTGMPHPGHREDLRFYALLDAVKIGTPPRRLASYYLDQANFHPEDVTEDLLEVTLFRVVENVRRIAQLRFPDSNGEIAKAQRRPGITCNWCPLKSSCEEGQAHLAAEAELI